MRYWEACEVQVTADEAIEEAVSIELKQSSVIATARW